MNILKPSFMWLGSAPDGLQILENVVKAGRVCYQSDKEGNEEQFVRNIIKRGHESVLEHEKISVVVICDRGVTHEIVRHRIASYSQESTRYVNYKSGVQYIDIEGGILRDSKIQKLDDLTIANIISEWLYACADAERHYVKIIELGASPQIARSVLNNSTKTQIVMTMNLREWRHFFKLRNDIAAHPQMREIAEELLAAFKDVVPVVFDDIPAKGCDPNE